MPLTLLGFLLSRAFPHRPTLPDSSSGDTLATFPITSEEELSGPQGNISVGDPLPSQEYCILLWLDALVSFHRFHGILNARGVAALRLLIRS